MQKNPKIVKFPVKRGDFDGNEIKSKHKRKRKINFLNLIFLLFIVNFLITAASQKKMIDILNNDLNDKKQELEEAKQEAESLSEDVAKIDDQEVLLDVVERIARNEYKMVRPDEIIYIDRNKVNNKFITGIGSEENNINIKEVTDTDEENKDSKESEDKNKKENR